MSRRRMSTRRARHVRSYEQMMQPAVVEGLILRWQRDRDADAREELVGEFMPLAHRLARRYLQPAESIDDLAQVASIGLLGAIDRFDASRSTGFPAFAIPTILGELKHHLRNTSWSAHVPRAAQETAMRIDRAVAGIDTPDGHAPTAAELAEFLKIDLNSVLIGLEAIQARQSASLEAPLASFDHDEPGAIIDLVGSIDGGYGLVETKLSLAECMPALPERERCAVRLWAGGERKQAEVAVMMGCSQVQVSRLLHRAADHVREHTSAGF